MAKQIKIGIVCPVGNLEKSGYHHIHDIVLQSFCSFADKVVLASSSRDANVAVKNPKIQVVSSPQAWFEVNERGNELYTMNKLIANQNLGLDVLAENDFDIGLVIHINQYIPETKFDAIQHYIQDFFQRSKPFSWLYKMYQCSSQLFDADRRLPWIYNLHYRNRYMRGPDSTLHFRNWLFWNWTKKVTIQSGLFKSFNEVSIVDVIGEFTEKECEALWTFVGDYGGYTKGRSMLVNGAYNHEVWLNYMVNKLKAKHPLSERLDPFGAAICERSRSDFVCHEILRRLEL